MCSIIRFVPTGKQFVNMSCVCECHSNVPPHTSNPHPPVTLTSSPLTTATATVSSPQCHPPTIAMPNPPAPVTSPATSRPPADKSIDQLDGATRPPATTTITTSKKVQDQQFIEQLDGPIKLTTPPKKSAAHQTNQPVGDQSSVEGSKDGAKRVMEDDADFKVSTKRFRTPSKATADNVS